MTHEFRLEITPFPENIVVEKWEYRTMIEMRDGFKLRANVYRPNSSGKFPAIMCFTPYGIETSPQVYGSRILKRIFDSGCSIGNLRVSETTSFEAPDPAYWVPNGYAVVYVDIAPRVRKEMDVLTKEEILDYYDMVEWVAKQDWCNGNVALSGVSYLAWSQWYCASMNPPHLKAIIVWEGVSDFYRDFRFPGGVPETNFVLYWYPDVTGRKFDENMLTQFFDPVSNQATLVFNPLLERIEVPALICASWSDQGLHCSGSFRGFMKISSKNKWLYIHGRRKWEEYYSAEALEYQKKFLDYFLKGIDNGWINTPKVRLEVRVTQDEYYKRFENDWPLPHTKYVKLYLDAARKALRLERVSEKSKVTYEAGDGQCYFDHKFEEDTELIGYMKLKLYVSTDEGDDMDLFVSIKKLDASMNEVYFYGMNGYIKGPVTRGWLRVSQRELDEKSTEWLPILKHRGEKRITPGEIVEVEIPLLPSGTLFRQNEVLRVVIAGWDIVNHPMLKYQRVVNRGKHTVYTGGGCESYLLVPVSARK
ncbi:MAG: CocE/NonD family hydrolase [Candidatus Caldarchaeum sp.]|nr:CocE/NonD family hydrolase [Candidatus Caldarchaeum sp.]